MLPDIMNQVAGSKFDFFEARLHDYFRSGIHSEEYPAITPQRGEDVIGIVYLDVNASALRRLDLFEGKMYDRKSVEVYLTAGDTCQSMTYILKPAYNHILTWQEWNYDEFLLQGKSRFIEKYFGFREID